MLKFTYKQTIRERVSAKCSRHPRYNPEKEGRNGIKGRMLYLLQTPRPPPIPPAA